MLRFIKLLIIYSFLIRSLFILWVTYPFRYGNLKEFFEGLPLVIINDWGLYKPIAETLYVGLPSVYAAMSAGYPVMVRGLSILIGYNTSGFLIDFIASGIIPIIVYMIFKGEHPRVSKYIAILAVFYPDFLNLMDGRYVFMGGFSEPVFSMFLFLGYYFYFSRDSKIPGALFVGMAGLTRLHIGAVAVAGMLLIILWKREWKDLVYLPVMLWGIAVNFLILYLVFGDPLAVSYGQDEFQKGEPSIWYPFSSYVFYLNSDALWLKKFLRVAQLIIYTIALATLWKNNKKYFLLSFPIYLMVICTYGGDNGVYQFTRYMMPVIGLFLVFGEWYKRITSVFSKIPIKIGTAVFVGVSLCIAVGYLMTLNIYFKAGFFISALLSLLMVGIWMIRNEE